MVQAKPRAVGIAWSALAVLWAVSAPPALAEEPGASRVVDPRVASPAGLGGGFTGLLSSGLALGEGPEYGLQAGEFIIQPRFFVEGEFRSNFFRVSPRSELGGTQKAEEMPIVSLHLRPGIAIFNPAYSIVAVSLGLDLDVQIPMTSNKAAFAQTNVGGMARAAASFFPKGVVSFTIKDEFSRSLWTPAAESEANRNRNQNKLGADVAFHPGGRAIDVSVGYRWMVEMFDENSNQDKQEHQFRLLGSWRFYPLTYAFVEATFDMVDWNRSPGGSGTGTDGVGTRVDGYPVKVYLGVSGYITESLALLARVGYGNSLLQRPGGQAQPEDFSSVIAQLQGTYRFTPRTVLHLGGERNFNSAAFGGYYDYFRAYLAFEQGIADIVLLHLDLRYDHRQFGFWDPPDVDDGAGGTTTVRQSHDNRWDDVLSAGLMADFHVSRIFGLTLGYRFEGVFSEFHTTASSLDTHTEYMDHRVYLTLNLRY